MRPVSVIVAITIAACVPANTSHLAPSDRPAEIIIVAPGSPADVAPRVVSAFMDNALPVSSSVGNTIEAKLGREMGASGGVQVTARAIVVPSDSGTTVRLYSELRDQGGNTQRLGAFGVAGVMPTVWKSLLAVGAAIQPDSTKRVVYNGPRP
jgi:hypothetical protein